LSSICTWSCMDFSGASGAVEAISRSVLILSAFSLTVAADAGWGHRPRTSPLVDATLGGRRRSKTWGRASAADRRCAGPVRGRFRRALCCLWDAW
jgi:hypothetical protein